MFLASDPDHQHMFEGTRLVIFLGFRDGHVSSYGHHGTQGRLPVTGWAGSRQHQQPQPALGPKSPRSIPTAPQLANPQETLLAGTTVVAPVLPGPQSMAAAPPMVRLSPAPGSSVDCPIAAPLVGQPTPALLVVQPNPALRSPSVV